MGGYNCNPNAQQFSGDYRKLLFQNEISSSNAANCQNDVTKILEVSFVKPKQHAPDQKELDELSDCDAEDGEPVFDYAYEDENCSDGETGRAEMREHNGEENVKTLNDHSKAYLASILETKLIKKIEIRGKKKCERCVNVFKENATISNEFIAFLSRTKPAQQPCKSTLNVIRSAEDFLKKYESKNVSFHSIVTHVVEKIVVFPLYELSEFFFFLSQK